MQTRKYLWWSPVVVLAVALVGQIMFHRLGSPTTRAQAVWSFQPKTLEEARDKAAANVQAEVISVERGEDLVMAAPAEPNGEDRIPTQRIKIRVKKSYKGSPKVGDELTLFQTGGTRLPADKPPNDEPQDDKGTDPYKDRRRVHPQLVVLESDPLYAVGEQYVLMLEPGPKGMLRTVSPEGRFKVEPDGSVKAVTDTPPAKAMHGKPLVELEKLFARK